MKIMPHHLRKSHVGIVPIPPQPFILHTHCNDSKCQKLSSRFPVLCSECRESTLLHILFQKHLSFLFHTFPIKGQSCTKTEEDGVIKMRCIKCSRVLMPVSFGVLDCKGNTERRIDLQRLLRNVDQRVLRGRCVFPAFLRPYRQGCHAALERAVFVFMALDGVILFPAQRPRARRHECPVVVLLLKDCSFQAAEQNRCSCLPGCKCGKGE